MKILICIPSFNEASNIGLVVRMVDEGVEKLRGQIPDLAGLIVNCDSASTDNTTEVFCATPTKTPKRGIRLPVTGKGENLLAFMRLAIRERADYCVTIDADITSANDDWISIMLAPLINADADFVTPLYARSRFEGSTTNHFAYPTVRAFAGADIRQPIGGDFAFGQKLMRLTLSSSVPAAARAYGIDIFLTLLASSHGLAIEQVRLGSKLHAPSFDKLEDMFPQVAETAAHVIRGLIAPAARLVNNSGELCITDYARPTASDKVSRMQVRARRYLADMGGADWLPEQAQAIARNAVAPEDPARVDRDAWVQVLAAWYQAICHCNETQIARLARELLPFFMLRSMTFWGDVASLTPREVESEIDAQAEALSELIRATVSI